MIANILTLTKEKSERRTERHLLPVAALSIKKLVFAALFCTVLMLFAAPARADVCSTAFPVQSCGVTITITGTSGHLTATIAITGGPYDGVEDQLVGITNNSSVAVGAIILNGPASSGESVFEFDGDGPCVFFGTSNCNPADPFDYEGPNNTFLGISSDFTTGKVLFTAPLAPPVGGTPGGSTWFALENTPTTVVAIGENKALTSGSTTTFPFGPFTCSEGTCTEDSTAADDLQIAPRNSAAGDTLTVAPVPQSFSTFTATNFPNLACVPYSDFSSAGNPGCVELELDCPAANSDACQFVYTATADFNIDKMSLPQGIGGAHFLGQHDSPNYNGQCPTAGFDVDIIESYTATIPDPITGGGRGNSCFVTAFDPTATPVPPGTTVSNFFGFEFPVSDTKVNPIFVPLPVPLSWDYHNSSGQPITNLQLCKNSSGTGCTAPWVYLSLTALTSTTACQTIASSSSPLPSLFNSGLLNFGKGEYSFIWNTATKVKGLSGCQVSVALQFDSGLVAAPAVFQYH